MQVFTTIAQQITEFADSFDMAKQCVELNQHLKTAQHSGEKANMLV